MDKILGIETSCDETAAAVITEDIKVLSNVVLSQDKIHAPFGGIVPELASRQHILSISYVVEEALQRAKISLKEVDVFSVTQGPGLVGSLLVGLSFAKAFSYYFNKLLIPVDHLQSHIQAAFIENREILFPSLALLVSGGHTSLYFLPRKLEYNLLGKTRDDAAGEALDKVAKFLELGYPGGPVIEKLASGGDPEAFHFSLPKMSDNSLDFSFSGFKTAALQHVKKSRLKKEDRRCADFVASFQMAIVQALISQTARAVKELKPRSLILCGGVARNKLLRNEFISLAESQGLLAAIPSAELCTDNAAMGAALA
ncbi:MAG: tRNA (adenosine(37)-N6)-threonylcarbamoyltransferase complex transferase subunit TsaD, partial [Acidobacteriota bacterium]